MIRLTADKNSHPGFAEDKIERAADKYLLQRGAAMAAHQHQVHIMLIDRLVQGGSCALVTHDVVRFHFMDLKITADMLLGFRGHFGTL